MVMRWAPFVAGVLVLGLDTAAAAPLASAAAGLEAGPEVMLVHHKPGHKGGPPSWANNREREASRSNPVVPRSTCRTTTETRYDPYRGAYVQRQVQVCDRY